MTPVHIVDARRSPIGRFGGGLKDLPAAQLGHAVAEAVVPAELRSQVGQVILGQVLQAGCGMNVARQVGLKLGLPQEVPGYTVNMACGSSLKAVALGADAIASGEVATTEETKIMERGNLRMDPLRHSVTWKGMDVALTVTEFMLLQALAQRPGFVKSRDQLMDVAYDDQVYVDDRTIDSHIKRLRKKMRAVDENFSAIETLYGIGYRYNEE